MAQLAIAGVPGANGAPSDPRLVQLSATVQRFGARAKALTSVLRVAWKLRMDKNAAAASRGKWARPDAAIDRQVPARPARAAVADKMLPASQYVAWSAHFYCSPPWPPS